MNSPTTPGQNSSGMNAARVVAVEAMIGHAMRFAAKAYARGPSSPSASFRSAYSVTTMAPSTSMPTARISENRTTMLTVSPRSDSTRMPVRNDPGMAMPTSPAVRTPKAPTTTIMTSRTALMTLFWRSLSIVRISSERSWLKVTCTDSGQKARSSSTTARTASMVSMMFSPVRLEISSATAG